MRNVIRRSRNPTWIWVLLGLSSCASMPTNFPIRSQVDGQRGFTMQGTVKYTGDPAKTRARIEKVFLSACAGPIEMTAFDLKRRDSKVGLKFYQYEAVAKCSSAPPAGQGVLK